MKLVSDELGSLQQDHAFQEFHSKCESPIAGDMQRFLTATMDEVRTAVSGRIARSVLGVIGAGDFGIFREVVLRRELTGAIAYSKQRDHSSHTVYNYLLGWYFFRHCTRLREALEIEFQKRGVGDPRSPFPFFAHESYFGCVWQYVSLLHDVGYMFEGGIPVLDLRESETQAAIGAETAKNFFNRLFWLDHGLELPPLREDFLNYLGISIAPPSFDNVRSLAGIADKLRFVGELQALSGPVGGELAKLGVDATRMPDLVTLSGDAFELWIHHYYRFGSPHMADRIKSLCKVFNQLIDKGLPSVDVRILDHGVCSGLLQILASTYYYRLYCGAYITSEPRPTIVQRFLDSCDWSPSFWWTGIVWATAATALHNVQQMVAAKRLDSNWPGPLRLRDDPLAYLGILVDTLEEWDRYSVFKAIDREPVQGTEVELGHEDGRIVICFLGPPARKRAKMLKDELDTGLSGWRSLLKVKP